MSVDSPFSSAVGARPRLFGVLHLPPLPGTPRAALGLGAIRERVAAEVRCYLEEGIEGLVLENHGDAPFHAESNPPEIIAAMAVIARGVRELHRGPLGINVLRNDARGALAVAAAAGAEFIRVNVLTGTTATDQGLVSGRARDVLDARRALGADVRIAADFEVKYGTPLYRPPRVEGVRGLLQRGGADAVILSGSATGSAADPEELRELRDGLGAGAPLLIGSGLTAENLGAFRAASGFIVGSAFKEDGYVENPVSRERVRRFVAAWRTLGPSN
ncbi:MAG: BtpA/SgcQ family protein [Planctomycetota bacterium]